MSKIIELLSFIRLRNNIPLSIKIRLSKMVCELFKKDNIINILSAITLDGIYTYSDFKEKTVYAMTDILLEYIIHKPEEVTIIKNIGYKRFYNCVYDNIEIFTNNDYINNIIYIEYLCKIEHNSM